MKNFTEQEVMHFTALFYNNWTETDFELAFKNSRLGWNYHWDKLQGKIKGNKANPTQAIVDVVLNMDFTHQKMLSEYILNEKYSKEISDHREWQIELEKHLEKYQNKG